VTSVSADRVGLFSSCLPGWSAGDVVDVAMALEFPVVEWGAGPEESIQRPEAGPEVRELCDRAGLLVSGVAVQDPGTTLGTPERVPPYLKLAVSLGARQVRLFAPPYRGDSLADEQRRARAALDAVVELAAAAGLIVLVETSPATLAPTPELAAALVEHHSPERAGVLYDAGNTVIEGYVAPELAVSRLGPYLHHVHVKNIAWVQRAGAWEWRCAGLSKGLLDWKRILAALSAAHYRGGFSIDHLGGKATRQRLATETDQLRRLVSQAQDASDSRSKEGFTSPANV
jgi:sugar phosphate isomerase/epimerase